MPPIFVKYPRAALLLVSVASLYLELLLIRWVGTEIRVFAYLQNCILVVCMLGLGYGALTSARRISLLSVLIYFGVLAVALSVPPLRSFLNDIGERFSAAGDFLIWNHRISQSTGERIRFLVQGMAMTYALIYVTCGAFIPIGRIIGRLIDADTNTIRAYSVNIVGSLLGIWLFVAMSVTGQPPVVWLVIPAFLLAVMADSRRVLLGNVAIWILLIGVAWWGSAQSGAIETHWSPYQKLALVEPPPDEPVPGLFVIEVNNVGYQGIVDTRPDGPAENHAGSLSRGLLPPVQGIGQYDLPTLVHPDPKNVLIVGAGSGNDAAGAVRGGAERITAVEIDPVIVDFGRRLHPEQPYSARNVEVVVDDARAYFMRTTERFDVISFGLLDAHTQTTHTNGRLDHFVYTRESIAQARRLLAPGGVMLLSFEPQRAYIADRIAATLFEVFGEDPLIFRMPRSTVGWGGVMFIAGNLAAVRDQMTRIPALGEFIRSCQTQHPVSLAKITPPTTDNWPYLYLKEPGIPLLFSLLGVLLVLLSLHLKFMHRTGSAPRPAFRELVHFFALGAGFMLLEIHNIGRSAVVLGTTWQSSAVVITGILIMILLANAVVYVVPKLPIGWAYVGLLGACVFSFLFDYSHLFRFDHAVRVLLIALLTALPVFFSGIIFIRSFASAHGKDAALGANLFGSVVGSVLQAGSMLLGLKALLIFAAISYGLALASARPEGLRSSREK